MATSFYGSTVTTSGSYGWRAYGSYSTSDSNTSTTVTLTGGFQSLTWNFDINNVACTGYVGSTTSSVSGQSVETSGTESVQLISMSKSITRTTSAQTVTLKVKTVSSSSYYPGTSTASVSITVPALTSYTITYNANGGSGAPSSQTKYYGKTLTLSSTKPTRTGYNFLGWSTSSSATSATYTAGGSYTANASATLYAVWETAIVAPTLSSFTAYRCDSSGAEDDEGEYAYLSVAYSADTGYNSSNVVESVVFSCSTASGSVTVSPSAVSGTATGIMSGVDTDLTHTITATATDSNGSTASATAKVGVVEFILDFSDTGKGVGILYVAPDEGINVGTRIYTYSTDLGYAHTHPTTANTVVFGVGSGGYNRGIYDEVADRWLVYASSSDVTYMQAQDGFYWLTSQGTKRIRYIDVGTVTVGGTANSVCSASVTFNVTFNSNPYIFVTPQTTVPGSEFQECGVSNLSTTGCMVYAYRTTSTTTTINWMAVGYIE